MAVDVNQLSQEGLLNLARSSGAAMSDRVTALNALLSAVANNQGAGWLRKALATDTDLDPVLLAAGSPARPQLTATVSAPADPGVQSDTITTVLSVPQLVDLARNRACPTATRVAAINQLLLPQNLIAINPGSFPEVVNAGQGVVYDQAEMTTVLQNLRAKVQQGVA